MCADYLKRYEKRTHGCFLRKNLHQLLGQSPRELYEGRQLALAKQLLIFTVDYPRLCIRLC